MLNIVVGSAFRNSAHNAPAYMRRVRALQDYVANSAAVRVAAVEGDSHDNTCNALLAAARVVDIPLHIFEASHGGPVFGSTEQPERMRALSYVGNTILDAVNPDDDVLVYVESDLLWEPATLWTLIDRLQWDHDFDVLSPLVFAGNNFYDVWGFRGADGERFAPFAPYHAQLHPTDVTPVSSVGSCLVMRASVARSKARMSTGALVEFCSNARDLGYMIGVAPTLRIHHPA